MSTKIVISYTFGRFYWKSTKLNAHKFVTNLKSTKFQTHENKWFYSISTTTLHHISLQCLNIQKHYQTKKKLKLQTTIIRITRASIQNFWRFTITYLYTVNREVFTWGHFSKKISPRENNQVQTKKKSACFDKILVILKYIWMCSSSTCKNS